MTLPGLALAREGKLVASSRPARVPVMLTSRADDAAARMVSAALAVLYAHWRRTGAALVF